MKLNFQFFSEALRRGILVVAWRAIKWASVDHPAMRQSTSR